MFTIIIIIIQFVCEYDNNVCIDIYTRSPLEDSRLFGPSPWKVLATPDEKNYF